VLDPLFKVKSINGQLIVFTYVQMTSVGTVSDQAFIGSESSHTNNNIYKHKWTNASQWREV